MFNFRYTFTPANCRTSEQRHQRLISEIRILDADIFCFQEVGVNYYSTLSNDLSEMGYNGDFCQKTLGTQEGLAIFYRKSAFECLSVKKLSFNEMLFEALEDVGLDASTSEPCERDHVFLLAKLQHLKSEKTVTVGNIHTIWENFSQPDVTVLQMALALVRLVNFTDGSSFVFAGDFNSAPNMPGYAFLADGELNEDHKEKLKEAATVLIDGKSLFEALEKFFTHCQTSLSSSYFEVCKEEPKITHYGHHPADNCLDYIWYDKNALEANCVLETVKLSSRIPNRVFPSDHLSLKSTFSFVNQ